MPQLADAGAAPALAFFPQGVLARAPPPPSSSGPPHAGPALRAPGEETLPTQAPELAERTGPSRRGSPCSTAEGGHRMEKQASTGLDEAAPGGALDEAAGSGERKAARPASGYRLAPPAGLKGSVEARELAPRVEAGDLEALVAGNTAFALAFLALRRTAAPSQNVALGAYGISQSMAMVYAGARGQTAAEMEAALHFPLRGAALHAAFNQLDAQLGARTKGVLLRNATQVWMQQGIAVHADFLDVLTRDYGAPLATLDIRSDPEAARAQINSWVATATEGGIGELLRAGSLDRGTWMVLSSALFFFGPWRHPFPEKETRDAAFSLADGAQVQVPMMQVTASIPYARSEGWRAVAMPYRQEALSMLVVMPSDLATFEASLSVATLTQIRQKLTSQKVELSIPRFRLGVRASLETSLRALGLGTLFGKPDLSGMSDRDIAIGVVEHAARVEVTERGTRASAATAVALQERCLPLALKVDRPFLFFIIDEPTSCVLFLGRVMDPR
ncbi:MAG TPA: serpin family protein [Polyangiaceae bacterium]|nr:serpin family protein [Polyangiaceae bacterium]